MPAKLSSSPVQLVALEPQLPDLLQSVVEKSLRSISLVMD
jgi:hypothetical protein